MLSQVNTKIGLSKYLKTELNIHQQLPLLLVSIIEEIFSSIKCFAIIGPL